MTPSLKRDAASGLVVLVPLFVTAYTLWWLYQTVASAPLVGALPPLIPGLKLVHDANETLARVLLTLAIVAAILFVTTWIMRTAFGAVVESQVDETMNQVPGFRVVYNASKIAVETAVAEDVQLRSPVKLHMWNDARLTGFRTGRTAPDGRTTLFVPASPVIFTGLIVEVPEERVVDVDESVEDALIRVISAGFAQNEADADAPIGRVDRSSGPGAAADE